MRRPLFQIKCGDEMVTFFDGKGDIMSAAKRIFRQQMHLEARWSERRKKEGKKTEKAIIWTVTLSAMREYGGQNSASRHSAVRWEPFLVRPLRTSSARFTYVQYCGFVLVNSFFFDTATTCMRSRETIKQKRGPIRCYGNEKINRERACYRVKRPSLTRRGGRRTP